MFKKNSRSRQQVGDRCEKRWLTETYDEYHQPIYRYIYRRIGDVETARELTADVFQRLVQVVCGGKTFPDSTRAWLYQAAHNIVIDEYRRRQHRQHVPLNEALVNNHDDPAEEAQQKLASERVRTALKLLTPDQQQIIALKFFEGFTNQEIADITNRSIGAVKALQHRGLATLQEILIPVIAENEPIAPPGLLTNVLVAESM